MTEALITDLAKIGALKVISRTSAMRYKGTDKTVPEIARELNVASVLEGSVLRAGNRVRITAQLIEAATDQHLWAESYERDLRDILTLQSEVARAVAREVQVKLTPGEESRLAQTRPVNEKAHEAYLKGRSLWNQNTADAIRRARDYFEEAIAIEPSYALAYAWLAQTHSAVGWYGTLPPKEALPKSKAVATKALQMDETLAEAYVSLGYSSTFYDWDWTAGERELTRAIELDPSSDRAHLSYFWFLVAQNRLDEAASEIHRAEELDPFSPMIRMNVGFYFWWARDPDRAIEHYLKLLELNPNSEEVHFFLGAAYLQMSMHGDAITEFERTLELSPGSTRNLAWLGHARALAGQRDEALAIVTQLMELSKRQYVSSYEVARIYAGLGDHDQVFTWLDRAYEERASWMAYLQVDPTLDPFRSDPRFQDLLRRMNFPES
jgi:tetratricopeptide (TPR) repeat protein